jgi:hypothetical protein
LKSRLTFGVDGLRECRGGGGNVKGVNIAGRSKHLRSLGGGSREPEDDSIGSDSSTGEGRDRAYGAGTIETVIRERVRATIEAIVEEKLSGRARSDAVSTSRPRATA